MPRIATPVALAVTLLAAPLAAAQITDFNTWTLVEDPADPNMSAAIDSASQATLTATGPVANAVDIGYQSVNGTTAAASTSGFAFDPTTSFSIAVDYDLSFTSTVGGTGIGLGIGEDGAGANSAGVAIGNIASLPAAAAAVARADNQPAAQTPFAALPAAVGSLHVAFDGLAKTITVGLGSTGANSPDAPAPTLPASVYNLWNTDADDDLLLASFFLRSDDTDPFSAALTTGSVAAVFSDFRVTSGTAVAVPEPATALLLAGLPMLVARRRRR
jgi:hypothetical protein